MKTVWIVSEGSPGHVSQSEGLVDALAAKIPLKKITVKGRTSVRGWQRHLIRYCMGRAGRPIPEKLLSKIVKLDVPKDSGKPDLIVSSGGKSVFAAHFFASKYQAPYVFIGERKPYPADWFHTVVSPVPGEASANSIDVELIPTPVTPQMIAGKGAVEPGTWCMIIGGTSRSHRFEEKDWIDVAEGMNTLAARENIRWLLTSSRRTGAAAESVLKKHLNPEVLKDAIWWAEQPRKELYTFMARSEVLFVTQDSVTMVTEAVSAGKPVVAIYPETVVIPKNSFMNAYFDRLGKKKRLIRCSTSDLERLRIRMNQFVLVAAETGCSVLDQLLNRLTWNDNEDVSGICTGKI